MSLEETRSRIANEAIETLLSFDPMYVDNPAVVFDIDDTLIDSVSERTIHSIHRLYDVVQQLGIPIFLVTARDPRYRAYTQRQLQRSNITGYQELLMIPLNRNRNRGLAKAEHRKYIESLGYRILMNVGDDPKDFINDTSIFQIKLPLNPG